MAYYAPGRYRCRVVDQGFGNSSQKGTPYFWIRIQPVELVLSADHAEACQESYDRDINMWLTDKTVDRVVEKLRHFFGWDGERWSDLDPVQGDYTSFSGHIVEASCELEQTDDKQYERWQLPPIGGVEHERKDDVVRTLDAVFGSALKKGGKARPKAAKQKVAADAEYTPPEPTEKDLPF